MKRKIIPVIITAFVLMASVHAQAQATFPPITTNLNFPQYQRLKTDNGYVYLEGGMRGIILYHAGENSYLAFDRACPHHLLEGCARVDVDASSLFLIDHCCKSSFNFSDGTPTGGPAQRSLIQYDVQMTGTTTLKITDEVIN